MESVRARQWWARGSLVLVAAAFVVLIALAGRRGLWLVLLTAAAVVVVVAAGFWFLLQRGVLRWLALALAVATPVAVLVLRAWVEPSSSGSALRVRVTRVDDLADRGEAPATAVVGDIDAACELVRGWLTAFLSSAT